MGKPLFHKGKSHFGSCSSEVSKVVGDFPHTPCVEECSLSQRRKRKISFPYSSSSAYVALVYHVGAKIEKGHKSMNLCGNHLCLPFFLRQIRMYSMNGTTLFKKLFLAFSFGL